MLKLIIVCFIALTILRANAQYELDGVQGQVGRICEYSNCVKTGGSCSASTQCCCPDVCWVNGKCGPKIPESFSQDGLRVVTGEVGEFQRYDSCENSLGRIGDYCVSFRQCCIPLNCQNNHCTADQTILENIGRMMSGGG